MTLLLKTRNNRYRELIGLKFGDLLFVRMSKTTGDGNRIFGWFKCDCGAKINLAIGRVVSGGRSRHCGCKTDMGKARTHGMHGTATYRSWSSMKGRCLSLTHKDYPKWGGRGITVCKQWADSFESFLKEVGPRPDGTTLDRIDGKRGYEPGNIRWATPKEQARNRVNFVIVKTPLGIMPLVDYANEIGLTKGAAHLRLKRGKLEGCNRV